MNIPYFNLDALPLKVDSYDYLRAVVAEEKRVCGPIDDRIRDLENKFVELVNQMEALQLTLNQTKGFFARWTIRTKMVALTYKIDTNRDMRYSLVCDRIKRTYA